MSRETVPLCLLALVLAACTTAASPPPAAPAPTAELSDACLEELLKSADAAPEPAAAPAEEGAPPGVSPQ